MIILKHNFNRLYFRVVFGSQQNLMQKCKEFTWISPTCAVSPIINIFHQRGTFVATDGSTLTYHNPESIVHYDSPRVIVHIVDLDTFIKIYIQWKIFLRYFFKTLSTWYPSSSSQHYHCYFSDSGAAIEFYKCWFQDETAIVKNQVSTSLLKIVAESIALKAKMLWIYKGQTLRNKTKNSVLMTKNSKLEH